VQQIVLDFSNVRPYIEFVQRTIFNPGLLDAPQTIPNPT
jgi:hypothetical protein